MVQVVGREFTLPLPGLHAGSSLSGWPRDLPGQWLQWLGDAVFGRVSGATANQGVAAAANASQSSSVFTFEDIVDTPRWTDIEERYCGNRE